MADDGKAGASSSSLSPAPWLWATSSLSSEGGMYDVFLYFRGEDTRFLFTDYLYHGLADVKKLQVFRDGPGLELGDPIKPTLMEAIKRSRIHIVVMSENYVCSSWCLLELEQMLKYSNDGTKRPVVPVFYHVTPAEVRYQISTKSKEAMVNHEKREGKDKAEAWKLALSTVCGLSGEHIVEKGNHYETAVIGKIAEQVSAKLLEIRQQVSLFTLKFSTRIMSKEPHHQLGPLNESWELFRSEVLGGEECPSDLEPIGKSIAESCKGLPLAIVTIAGVVKKRKRSKTEWESIEKLIPHWCDDDDIDRMMKILKMSYDDLPKKLNPCFLYLGVFLEDYPVKVREIIYTT